MEGRREWRGREREVGRSGKGGSGEGGREKWEGAEGRDIEVGGSGKGGNGKRRMEREWKGGE